MNKFGIPDSVINSVNAVLEAGNKMPRQLKDPKKETMMGFQYKPGKVRNQVVDKKDVKDKEKKGYIHTENIAIESLEIAKLIEDYQLNEYFDREHVGSSKNYHVHSTNPEEGSYELTHKKTGKKTSINVSDNYPMNRTKHVKKDIKGKVPGSDHHSIAKKINQHLQGGRPAGTHLDQDGRDHTAKVRRDLHKQDVKRSDALESIESLEIAKLIEDYQLNEYFDKEHVGSSKNYHIHSTNPEEGEYSLTHKKTGKKTSINVSDNYPMNKTKHVSKNIAGKVPGSDHHSIAKKINSHLQFAGSKDLKTDTVGTGDDRRSLRKQGVKRSDAMEAFEDDIAEAMEMHLKPHGTEGTHYTVHKVGKKLAAHGGVKVGEKLSDTQVDDARDSGVKVKHVKEDTEKVEEGAMKRGTALKTFRKKPLDPVDHKDLKGSHADRKDKDIDNDGEVDDSDEYLHHRRKTVKKAMKEGVGDEKVRSSAQAAQLAKHYYAKAKQAQSSGSAEEAAKMMSAAKTFYRKSEADQAQEKGGKQVAKAESTENIGIGEYYFNELEIEEIEAAEDIVTEVVKSGKYAGNRKSDGSMPGESARSGQRVTKTEKEGPEHIVMQARKVVSLGQNHSGVEFKDGSKAKVNPKHAQSALNRYNSAKSTDKEHMQNTMDHSHAGFKHVASGKPMDHPDNPHKPKTNKLGGADRRTDRAVGLMKHPDDED